MTQCKATRGMMTVR